MITDYFIVRKQKLKLSSFYTPDETSIYWYWHGALFLSPPPPLLTLHELTSLDLSQVSIPERSSAGFWPSSRPCPVSLPASPRARSSFRSAGSTRPGSLGSLVRTASTPKFVPRRKALTMVLFIRSSGFAIASTLWVASNKIWPPPGIGEVDEYDFRDQPSVDESADEEKRVSAEEVDKVQEPALRY